MTHLGGLSYSRVSGPHLPLSLDIWPSFYINISRSGSYRIHHRVRDFPDNRIRSYRNARSNTRLFLFIPREMLKKERATSVAAKPF